MVASQTPLFLYCVQRDPLQWPAEGGGRSDTYIDSNMAHHTAMIGKTNISVPMTPAQLCRIIIVVVDDVCASNIELDGTGVVDRFLQM